MGLFGFGNKSSNNTTTGGINLSKEERVNKINLNKEKVHTISLSKTPLNGLTSRVAAVLDFSGSMRSLYRDGSVQNTLEALLPLAMEFDDNGELELWIFENGFHRLPNLTLDNFYGYVEREIMSKYSMGGTSYAPVMQDIVKRYTKEEPAKIPNYIMFITDGDNNDHGNTNKVITEASNYPIFWQFIGIGNESFNYLQKLDDMTGRYVDNADFFKVGKPSDITYEKLLNEYPGWVADPKVKAML